MGHGGGLGDEGGYGRKAAVGHGDGGGGGGGGRIFGILTVSARKKTPKTWRDFGQARALEYIPRVIYRGGSKDQPPLQMHL